MILNEKVKCRASAGFWLPFTAIGLGLVATPVVAQEGERETVRIEVRVNGKNVDDLSAAERKALLRKLLGGDDAATTTGRARRDEREDRSEREDRDDRNERGRGGKTRGQQQPRTSLRKILRTAGEEPQVIELDDVIEAGEGATVLDLSGAIQHLEKAKALIVDGGETVRLLEVGDVHDALRALHGSGKDARTRKVRVEHDGERSEEIDDVVQEALKNAHESVLEQIRNNEQLRRLGVSETVESTIEKLLHGEDMHERLHEVIRKASGSSKRAHSFDVFVTPEVRTFDVDAELKDVRTTLEGLGDTHFLDVRDLLDGVKHLEVDGSKLLQDVRLQLHGLGDPEVEVLDLRGAPVQKDSRGDAKGKAKKAKQPRKGKIV